MHISHKRFGLIVLGLAALSLLTAGCYFLQSYFEKLAGMYGITYMYNGYPSTHTNTLTFNSDGTVAAQTKEVLFGGSNPTKGTWSQDNDKVQMNFAGTDSGYPVTSTLTGTLKDKSAKEITGGTWSSTYQIGSSTYPDSGTWTATKK